ncbi:hypothetical protein NP493_2077g00002 [Ridgeia piscesae]|uniref:Uncharacterized protein n=1 Tax=Ridgeia piscesae TaxID=27915 RepID=A0AAD9JLP4_RIDPI|nr:hypothetical protein NP493_2077g00002 [Ridgeia piscesae]
MKTTAGASSSYICLCKHVCSSVSVTPVSCQSKILVSVCHLPDILCILSMTRSILTVPFAFLINVSSLILSWSNIDIATPNTLHQGKGHCSLLLCNMYAAYLAHIELSFFIQKHSKFKQSIFSSTACPVYL